MEADYIKQNNMKKKYFAPDMEIVEIGTRYSLLAGSPDLGNSSLPDADLDDVVEGSGIEADAPGFIFSY